MKKESIIFTLKLLLFLALAILPYILLGLIRENPNKLQYTFWEDVAGYFSVSIMYLGYVYMCADFLGLITKKKP